MWSAPADSKLCFRLTKTGRLTENTPINRYLFQAPASLFTYLTIIHLKSQNRLNRMWLVCLFISCPNH